MCYFVTATFCCQGNGEGWCQERDPSPGSCFKLSLLGSVIPLTPGVQFHPSAEPRTVRRTDCGTEPLWSMKGQFFPILHMQDHYSCIIQTTRDGCIMFSLKGKQMRLQKNCYQSLAQSLVRYMPVTMTCLTNQDGNASRLLPKDRRNYFAW